LATKWQDKFQLNIKEIDAQHRRFFEILESTDSMLEKTELNEQDVFQIMRLLMDLRNYGFFHFHTEEKLMVKAGYPEFLSHMDLHDDYMSAMNKHRLNFVGLFHTFKEGTDNRDEIFAYYKDFVAFASEWYQNHISNEDAKYAYFIKQK
jgi:hemerythrin